jgi:SPP1 gp7 family putative phage head morphogenesis protein
MQPNVNIKPMLKALPRNKRRIRVSPNRGIKSPKFIELDYYTQLAKQVSSITAKCKSMVLNRVDRQELKDKVLDDSWFADLERLLADWEMAVKRTFHVEHNKRLAKIYINKTDRYQKGKFVKLCEYGFGIDIGSMPEFQEYQPFINQKVRENTKLIGSLTVEQVAKIKKMLRTAVQEGLSVAQMVSRLGELDREEKRRASLIARNEIKNVTTQLTEERYKNLGIDMYEWQTSGDERVRGNPSGLYPKADPSHYDMDGKICRFDDKTVYSDNGGLTWKKRHGKMPFVNAGEAILCRCVPIPYMRLD